MAKTLVRRWRRSCAARVGGGRRRVGRGAAAWVGARLAAHEKALAALMAV